MSDTYESPDQSAPNVDDSNQNHVNNEEESNGVIKQEEDEEKEVVLVHHVENKDDVFEDANEDVQETWERDNVAPVVDHAEELGRLQDALDKALLEKEGIEKEYKEERESVVKEVSGLVNQLKSLTGKEKEPDGTLSEDGISGGVSLHELMSGCSQLVATVLEERKRSDGVIRELQQQIEELNTNVQPEQSNEVGLDRILGSLSMVVNQEELSDHSVGEKMAQVERSIALLVDQHKSVLDEIDQLKQYLSEVGLNIGTQEVFSPASFLVAARTELVDVKTKEEELTEKLRHLEEENRKFAEEVEKEKGKAEAMVAELEKVNAEVEQERNRYGNTREKLSMAVNKGKALVQQRDTLKQSLAEKSSELDRCLAELQVKSNALDALEQQKEELVKFESSVASLEQTLSERNAIIGNIEDIFSQTSMFDELEMIDIVEKLKWLVNQVASLQKVISEKNATVENFEEIFLRVTVPDYLMSADVTEKLKWLVESMSAIEDRLSQRNLLVANLEEVFYQISVPAELQQSELIDRVRWIVEERNALTDNLREFDKLKIALSVVHLPEIASSSDMGTKISCLKEMIDRSKEEISKLQDEIARSGEAARSEIDRLSASLTMEMQEKEYMEAQLNDLTQKYESMVDKSNQGSSEKDQMVRTLLQSSGLISDDLEGCDVTTLVERCFQKIKEESHASSGSLNNEVTERFQGLLYVTYQDRMLYEKLLEEDTLITSELNSLNDDLRTASKELAALKEEKDSLQKDLERSEEKSSLLRDKLSLAVKKGKGLFQDRENLKLIVEERNSEIEKLKLELQKHESNGTRNHDHINQLSIDIDEKNSTIEKLMLELQQQESNVSELNDQITQLSINMNERNSEIEHLKLELQQQEDQISKLSADAEQIPKLEADLSAVEDQKNQLEQLLSEGNRMLQRVLVSIDRIVLPDHMTFEEPVGKVDWVAGYMKECEETKIQAEQELARAKEESRTLASQLAEVQLAMKSVEDELLDAKNQISQLAEEKREIEVSRKSVEDNLQKAQDETTAQTSKFAELHASKKSLEDALSVAENKISELLKELEDALLSKAAAESELEKLREEVASIKALEDASSLAENKISELSIELEDARLSKAATESELEKLREEVAGIKSLEDASSVAENKISELSKELEDARLSKAAIESELEKIREEVASIKSLGDASFVAENKISELSKEVEDARLSKAVTERELEKLREEVAIQADKLTEAYRSTKSLEDALSREEAKVSQMTEQNNTVQVGSVKLENDLKQLKSEAESQAVVLEEAKATIKSLEDALLKASSDISSLEDENRIAIQEISALNSKLTACMDQLAGKDSNLESRSVELIHHITDLQMLVKDHSVLSVIRKSFVKELENLKRINDILDDIRNHTVDTGLELLQANPGMEDDSHLTMSFPFDLGANLETVLDNGEVTTDPDNVCLYIKKMGEVFALKNKFVADNVEGYSKFTDEFVEALLRKLGATRDALTIIFEHMESLKYKMKSLALNEEQKDNTISKLEKDDEVLLSACVNATNELRMEVKNNLLELSSIPELQKLSDSFVSDGFEISRENSEHDQKLCQSNSAECASKLLLAARKVRSLIKQFESASNVAATSIEDLQHQLRQTEEDYDNATRERAILDAEVSQLKNQVETLENSCQVLSLELGRYQDLEEKLQEKDTEISNLHNNLLMKQKESKGMLMSTSQLRSLFDKIKGIEMSSPNSTAEDMDSDDVDKLFYIIDSVTGMKHELKVLSNDKDELQSKLSEVTNGLEKIIYTSGGNKIVQDQRPANAQRLLPILEKQVISLSMEAENSKSYAQELGNKLVESQKVIDELSKNRKLLEDSLQSREAKPEFVQERSIFEEPSLPTSSEISEIEDVGPAGKKATASAPSAAHVRTMRKGSSTDHLALDMESVSLLNDKETDEDKGHVFKSLSTSGLIPTQGKLIADRVDGLWVSGGRVLMNRPRARLGVIAYCLVLHLWLVATIL